MRITRAIRTALSALVLAGAAQGSAFGSSLSSPMVDRAIYRPGAITRFTGRFGSWTVVCDEIKDLKQRFCSLKSATSPNPHGQVIRLDVSTGDDGRPAALIHLPIAVSLPFGVRVAPAKPAKGSASRLEPKGRSLAIVNCTGRECLAIWDLAAADLRSLSSGQGLSLTICSMRPGRVEFAPDLGRRVCEVKLASLLSGAGFQDAVQASMR